MLAPAVFAFGLVAFGFLGMGPVTIAVDSYGPVTDNAQSVYELSLIEQIPGIKEELKKDYNIDVNFERAKEMLEANDGAGNTFKATAKPVLIGTAVVGATTMIFSIIMALTHGLTENVNNLSLLHAPFVLGLITGGAMIYWFTGASTQAVTTGAYRAVEFIKANIHLEGAAAASIADSKKVVEICTKYAQKGMLNIFIAVFFATLSFAFIEPFFFIGYLFSIAIFGLYQAIFMANAGGAWDNAKKIVEVELKQKGTPLHDATVIGDTVGDPFKDTSSVALNPVIKFTTLFGLLAVELAVQLTASQGSNSDAHTRRRILRRLVRLRLPFVLQHAHPRLRRLNSLECGSSAAAFSFQLNRGTTKKREQSSRTPQILSANREHLELIRNIYAVRREGHNGRIKCPRSSSFKPACRTPRVRARLPNQPVPDSIRVNVVQPRQICLLTADQSIPILKPNGPAGSSVYTIDILRRYRMQMLHELSQGGRLARLCDKMVVI